LWRGVTAAASLRVIRGLFLTADDAEERGYPEFKIYRSIRR